MVLRWNRIMTTTDELNRMAARASETPGAARGSESGRGGARARPQGGGGGGPGGGGGTGRGGFSAFRGTAREPETAGPPPPAPNRADPRASPSRLGSTGTPDRGTSAGAG